MKIQIYRMMRAAYYALVNRDDGNINNVDKKMWKWVKKD